MLHFAIKSNHECLESLLKHQLTECPITETFTGWLKAL